MKSIKQKSEGLYKEKGSKFLSFALPCSSIEQAKSSIAHLRAEHPKAVHVCFAWRIGFDPIEERYSDDGEPNNSAGKPIFGQLVGGEFTNLLVAVVRYYGGTKLGVGGLVSAYKLATKSAIDSATIIDAVDTLSCKITFDPNNTGRLMSLLNNLSITPASHFYEGTMHGIEVEIPKSRLDEILPIFKDSNIFTFQIKE